jgi:hypothetical protein
VRGRVHRGATGARKDGVVIEVHARAGEEHQVESTRAHRGSATRSRPTCSVASTIRRSGKGKERKTGFQVRKTQERKDLVGEFKRV